MHSGVRKYFGTLEQLRRGTWIEEPVEDPNAPETIKKPAGDPKAPAQNANAPSTTASKRKRLSINPVDENALSIAHAALAEVIYNDDHPVLKVFYVNGAKQREEQVQPDRDQEGQ